MEALRDYCFPHYSFYFSPLWQKNTNIKKQKPKILKKLQRSLDSICHRANTSIKPDTIWGSFFLRYLFWHFCLHYDRTVWWQEVWESEGDRIRKGPQAGTQTQGAQSATALYVSALPTRLSAPIWVRINSCNTKLRPRKYFLMKSDEHIYLFTFIYIYNS